MNTPLRNGTGIDIRSMTHASDTDSNGNKAAARQANPDTAPHPLPARRLESGTRRFCPEQKWVIASLFGARHWALRWVLDLCTADPHFLNHLIEQQGSYVHYLCLLRLAPALGGTVGLDMESPAVQAKQIRTTSRKKLLERLYGACPSGLLTALEKLGPKPLGRGDYQALMNLRDNPQTMRLITHRSAIHASEMDVIARVPAELHSLPLLARITSGRRARAFLYLIDMARVLRPDLDLQELARRLGAMRDLRQLLRWVREQLHEHEFTPPPWEGNAWIRPIRTVAGIHAAARRFENCARGYIEESIQGREYFYESNRGPALILIKKDPLLGWWVDEYKGIKNRKLLAPLAREILDAFAAAGIAGNRGWDRDLSILLSDEDDVTFRYGDPLRRFLRI
jgi:hypothetical protein